MSVKVTNLLLENATEHAEPDLHKNLPQPNQQALYGLAGKIARIAADNSEANPFAVAANYLTYLSAAVGRDCHIKIGDTVHHPRLFTLHVGRSGIGRKGDAMSLVNRVFKESNKLMNGGKPFMLGSVPFCGQYHSGGLSSREGLALLVHDGFTVGKEDFPPIQDKRVLVRESEFANVLAQTKRDGNTLSAALRDLWDGGSIQPAVKSSRIWST